LSDVSIVHVLHLTIKYIEKLFPVILIDDAWLQGRHIPWHDFVLFLSESFLLKTDDDALAREFERIAYGLSRNEMDRRRRILQKYAPSILWAANNSVVAEVLLVDAWELYQNEIKYIDMVHS
jgi:hypothetical protein